jgi:hypothetical protein
MVDISNMAPRYFREATHTKQRGDIYYWILLDNIKMKRPDFSGLYGQYRTILDCAVVAMQGFEPRTLRI